MRKIRAVAVKELKQIGRDPLTLVILIGLPAFLLVLFGYAISFDVEHIRLGIQDRDRSAASRELIEAFLRSGKFDRVEELPAGAKVDGFLERRRVQAVLVVPEAYGRDLDAGREVRVQFLLDGTDATTATTVQGYAEAITAAVGAGIIQRGLTAASGATPLAAAIEYRPRVWYNPELESSYFLVPGLIAFIMMLTGVLSTALSLVREKERGTLEQLRVAPLRTFQLLVGKTIPHLAVALAGTYLVLLAARLLFGLEVKGSQVDLFLATLLFLIGALAWGLLVSTLADTQAAAFQFGIFSALLPTMILSGFIFPIRNMPQVLQWLSYLVPARYYLVILRGIVLKGADLSPYWDQMALLALYTTVVLILATVRFARRNA